MEHTAVLSTTNDINSVEMKKNVEWWHLILTALALMVAVWGAMSMYFKDVENSAKESATKVENHEQRIKQLEYDRAEIKQDLREIKQSQQEILILLQNKADRK